MSDKNKSDQLTSVLKIIGGTDLSVLWEDALKPTKIESFEENGKATHLVVQPPQPLKNKNIIIKK